MWELSQHRVEAAAAWTVETHSIQPSSKQDVKMLGVVVLVLCLFGPNAFKTEKCRIRDFVCQKARGQLVISGKILKQKV